MNTQAPPPARDLDSFRGCHAGATVIVCGCGASLRGFVPPAGVPTIGVNDVGRAFDPDYLVVLNGPAQFAADRFRHVAASRARAVFSHLDLGLRGVPLVRFRLGRQAGIDPPRRGELHYARNSPYTAVHLAALMGAARIGLIGVDFTEDHFFGATGAHPLTPTLARIDAEYGALAEALARRGVELVNLSPISRIASLPRREVAAFLAKAGTGAGTGTDAAPPVRPRRARLLTLAIQRQRSGPIGDLMDALALSAAALGHTVRRGPPGGLPGDTVAVAWNGRSLHWTGPRILCEHGWLPRAAYQISPAGINADSHIAPFAWDGAPLPEPETERITRHLARLAREARQNGSAPDGLPPGRFYLVPLQMEYDTNLTRHAPPNLRRMQDLIDAVARADPPLPVVFKQHPADLKRGGRQARLRMRRRQDLLWVHGRGDVHALLASGRCAGIVSINSNVVHDGLIHGVPAVVLGRNVWPTEGRTPFLTALPADWADLDASRDDPERRACRLAYAHHLVRHQWTLADARMPERVAALLASVATAGSRGARPAPPPVDLPVAAVRALRPRTPARARATPRPARVDVFARNKGWRFEQIKVDLAARARSRGLAVTVSDRPRHDADAWIAIRTAEAPSSPDPARTLVQVHDVAAVPDGPGSALPDIGRVQVLHPSLAALLTGAGVQAGRILPCLVPGSCARGDGTGRRGGFRAGWFGRPEIHQGRERHRPDLFVAALCAHGPGIGAVLAGDRLTSYAEALRQAGLDVATLPVGAVALADWPRHIAALDCLVLTGAFDPAPQPLFDALALGVPVIAPRAGWAADLLGGDGRGHFAATADEIAAALRRVAAADRPAPDPAMATARTAWLDQALDAALALAGTRTAADA